MYNFNSHFRHYFSWYSVIFSNLNVDEQELEYLVNEQLCATIRERGIAGELERKLQAADTQLECYRRRCESLQKQVKCSSNCDA